MGTPLCPRASSSLFVVPSMDFLKNLIDAGASFTELNRERAESIVNEMVREGQVRIEEYQRNVQELLDRSRTNAEHFNEMVRGQVMKVLTDLGVLDESGKPAVVRAWPTKKAAASKATAKKVGAKKAPAKWQATTNTLVRSRPGITIPQVAAEAMAKKAPAKKAPAKKAAAKEVGAKKAPAKRKATTKRAPAKKAAGSTS